MSDAEVDTAFQEGEVDSVVASVQDNDEHYPLQNRLSRSNPLKNHPVDIATPLISRWHRYPTKSETYASARRTRKESWAHQQRERRYHNADWRVVLSNMARLTPTPEEWHSRALEMLLDPQQAKQFDCLPVGERPWEIEMRTHSIIEPVRDQERITSLILSGEDQGLRLCVEHLVHLLGPAQIQRRLTTSDENYRPPRKCQACPTETLRKRLRLHTKTINTTVDAIPYPEIWSKESLENYIGNLIRLRPSAAAMHTYVLRNQEHQHEVVKRVVNVLMSVAPPHALSLPALKLALSFMGQNGGKFVKQMVALFQAMKILGFQNDTECMNILLESCAKTGNLTLFNRIIIAMSRANVYPDLLTWNLYMRMVKDPLLLRQIVQEVRSRGMIRHPCDRVRGAIELVGHDLEHFIRSHGQLHDVNLDEFIAQQDAEWGDIAWLDRHVFQRMAEVLGRFGLMRRVPQLLPYLERNSIHAADIDIFNTLLVHVQRQASRSSWAFINEMARIVHAMERYRCENILSKTRCHRLEPSHFTYETLFRFGLKLNLPNIAAVAWRYAAVNRKTTSYMRLTVTRYLIFGRTRAKSRPLPLLQRAYIRRLFLDPILKDVFNDTLTSHFQQRRLEESMSLAQLRGEPGWKHLDLKSDILSMGEEICEEDLGETINSEEGIGKMEGTKKAEAAYVEEAEQMTQHAAPVAQPGDTVPLSLSLIPAFRSQFKHSVWYILGLKVAQAYEEHYHGWEPVWSLDRAISEAIYRDKGFRKRLDAWNEEVSQVRRGIRRGGMSHAIWLRDPRNRPPLPIQIPFCHLQKGNPRPIYDLFGKHVKNSTLQLPLRRRNTRPIPRMRRTKASPFPEKPFRKLFQQNKLTENRELHAWMRQLENHSGEAMAQSVLRKLSEQNPKTVLV